MGCWEELLMVWGRPAGGMKSCSWYVGGLQVA